MAFIGDPGAAHQLRLADIQRRDPVNEPFAVVCPGEHLASSVIGVAAARRNQGHSWTNLILVLEATLNGP
jgi:hypothetical protein